MALNESFPVKSRVENDSDVSEQLLLFFYIFVRFSYVFNIVMGMFGCVTNTLNMAVFIKMGFKESINMSLFVLSTSDFGACFTLIFYGVCMNPQLVKFFREMSVSITDVSDIAIFVAHLMFVATSMLITAFMSVERCLCVVFPHKVKLLITPTTVKCILPLLFLAGITVQCPTYFGYRLGWGTSRNQSIFTSIFTETGEKMMPSLILFYMLKNASIYSVVIVCSSITVISLTRRSKWRRSVTRTQSTTNEDSSSSSKETRVTKVVLFVSLLFIGCYSPNMCFMFTMFFVEELQETEYALYLHIIYQIIVQLILLFEAVNITVNLFIYYKTSSRFYKIFNEIFSFHRNGMKCFNSRK